MMLATTDSTQPVSDQVKVNKRGREFKVDQFDVPLDVVKTDDASRCSMTTSSTISSADNSLRSFKKQANRSDSTPKSTTSSRPPIAPNMKRTMDEDPLSSTKNLSMSKSSSSRSLPQPGNGLSPIVTGHVDTTQSLPSHFSTESGDAQIDHEGGSPHCKLRRFKLPKMNLHKTAAAAQKKQSRHPSLQNIFMDDSASCASIASAPSQLTVDGKEVPAKPRRMFSNLLSRTSRSSKKPRQRSSLSNKDDNQAPVLLDFSTLAHVEVTTRADSESTISDTSNISAHASASRSSTKNQNKAKEGAPESRSIPSSVSGERHDTGQVMYVQELELEPTAIGHPTFSLLESKDTEQANHPDEPSVVEQKRGNLTKTEVIEKKQNNVSKLLEQLKYAMSRRARQRERMQAKEHYSLLEGHTHQPRFEFLQVKSTCDRVQYEKVEDEMTPILPANDVSTPVTAVIPTPLPEDPHTFVWKPIRRVVSLSAATSSHENPVAVIRARSSDATTMTTEFGRSKVEHVCEIDGVKNGSSLTDKISPSYIRGMGPMSACCPDPVTRANVLSEVSTHCDHMKSYIGSSGKLLEMSIRSFLEKTASTNDHADNFPSSFLDCTVLTSRSETESYITQKLDFFPGTFEKVPMTPVKASKKHMDDQDMAAVSKTDLKVSKALEEVTGPSERVADDMVIATPPISEPENDGDLSDIEQMDDGLYADCSNSKKDTRISITVDADDFHSAKKLTEMQHERSLGSTKLIKGHVTGWADLVSHGYHGLYKCGYVEASGDSDFYTVPTFFHEASCPERAVIDVSAPIAVSISTVDTGQMSSALCLNDNLYRCGDVDVNNHGDDAPLEELVVPVVPEILSGLSQDEKHPESSVEREKPVQLHCNGDKRPTATWLEKTEDDLDVGSYLAGASAPQSPGTAITINPSSAISKSPMRQSHQDLVSFEDRGVSKSRMQMKSIVDDDSLTGGSEKLSCSPLPWSSVDTAYAGNAGVQRPISPSYDVPPIASHDCCAPINDDESTVYPSLSLRSSSPFIHSSTKHIRSQQYPASQMVHGNKSDSPPDALIENPLSIDEGYQGSPDDLKVEIQRISHGSGCWPMESRGRALLSGTDDIFQRSGQMPSHETVCGSAEENFFHEEDENSIIADDALDDLRGGWALLRKFMCGSLDVVMQCTSVE